MKGRRGRCLEKGISTETDAKRKACRYGEDFLAYGCANTSLKQFPFAFAKTSIQAHSQLQSCYPPNKDATDLFSSFMDVQTQA
jgi:hypothetical protein